MDNQNDKKMRKLFFIILISNICNSQSEVVSLSIEDAVKYGVENNRNLKNAEREIQMAYQERWKTIAIGLPNVSLDLNYLNNLELPTSLIPAEFFGGNKGDFSEIQFGTEQTAIGSVRMEQLLFDGSWLVGLEYSKIFLATSENFYEKTLLEVREAIVKLYSLVATLNEGISLLENNLKNFKKDLNEVIELYKNGFQEKENVEQIRITLAQAELSLLQAIKTRDNQLNLLKLVLGLNINDELVLITSLDNFIGNNVVFANSFEDFDTGKNVDIKISQNMFDTKRIEYKLEKSKQLPKISGFVSGTYTGYNNEFNFTDKSQSWFGSSVIGVNLEIPLFNANRMNVSSQKAKIAMEKAKSNLEEQEERTQAEVIQKLNDYQLANKSLSVNEQNMNLAISIEDKNSIKFFEGLVSSFELRQAQIQLLDSQQKYLNSVIELISIKTELETLYNN
jgi:outer membrane protein TolC|tara:strand:- start:272 stop:1621 length:1350 start_codon:yes stop_codon:yes gene_type:complete